jgi:transcriptional regulator with XRE-family HTH domain
MKMSATEKITENIREIIRKSGLKQCVVAERSGFNEKEFSNILNGRKQLRAEHIPQIANALGVTPNDIFQKSA